jgi:beta-galactosidase/beta-glucuronidase
MAIPDRVNLFRAQALRSVGGNGWRMSHNPPAPNLLDVLDRVGVVAMDETRIMGTDNVSVRHAVR